MKITFRLRVTAYDLVREAVESGVARGYHRAYKYQDAPSEQDVITSIVQSVMGGLCDTLDFDTATDADDAQTNGADR